eukprot:scaffold1051_cov254-Pinguiococcus_pyrenoidosus.AAC.17
MVLCFGGSNKAEDAARMDELKKNANDTIVEHRMELDELYQKLNANPTTVGRTSWIFCARSRGGQPTFGARASIVEAPRVPDSSSALRLLTDLLRCVKISPVVPGCVARARRFVRRDWREAEGVARTCVCALLQRESESKRETESVCVCARCLASLRNSQGDADCRRRAINACSLCVSGAHGGVRAAETSRGRQEQADASPFHAVVCQALRGAVQSFSESPVGGRHSLYDRLRAPCRAGQPLPWRRALRRGRHHRPLLVLPEPEV